MVGVGEVVLDQVPAMRGVEPGHGGSTTAGSGPADARARPQSTEMVKICFSPSDSLCLA